jgi:hypothetical protein
MPGLSTTFWIRDTVLAAMLATNRQASFLIGSFRDIRMSAMPGSRGRFRIVSIWRRLPLTIFPTVQRAALIQTKSRKAGFSVVTMQHDNGGQSSDCR